MTKKQFLASLLVLAVSGLAGGFISDWLRGGSAEATSAAPTIKAGEILLVDKAGKTRGGLQMVSGEPRIFLSNKEGKPRANLSLKGESPDLVFYDKNQVKRFSLNLDDKTGPLLQMLDKNGKPGLKLRFWKGGPALTIMHKGGKKRALYLTVDQRINRSLIGLNDIGGTNNISLSVQDDIPRITLHDNKLDREIMLEVSDELGPLTSLTDSIAGYMVVNQIHHISGPYYKMVDTKHDRWLYLKMDRERAFMGASAKPPHNKVGYFSGLVGDKPFISLEDPSKSDIYVGMGDSGKPKIELTQEGKKLVTLPK